MNKTEFKAEMKKQLTLKGWGYKELSERTGYKQHSIQVMMCDDKKLTPQAMCKFAEILGIDGFELAEGKGNRFPRVVYAIMHNKTKKIYIGSSKNASARYVSHIQALRKGKHIVEEMQSDFERFGEDFSLFIIDEIKEPSQCDKEYEWMEKYKTYNKTYGYNYKDKAFSRWRGNIEIPLKDGRPPLPDESGDA